LWFNEVALIKSMPSPLKSNESLKQTVWEIAHTVWNPEAESLRSLRTTIDPEILNQCATEITKCQGRVLTAGCGTSAAAARKMAHSLCCVGRPAVFLAPGDALHGGLGLAQPADLAVLISKGGNTRGIVSLLTPLRAKHVSIIGVTENPILTAVAPQLVIYSPRVRRWA
jgi:D-arabinose 5-phosphate isomerase GutQ